MSAVLDADGATLGPGTRVAVAEGTKLSHLRGTVVESVVEANPGEVLVDWDGIGALWESAAKLRAVPRGSE